MDASQYKDYVLTLLFMKYVSDKYTGSEELYSDIVVPPDGSFADMAALKGTKEIGDGINKVIGRLADANGSLLKGVIDQADFNDESRLGRGREMTDRLTELVGIFERLDFRANRAHGDDLLGDAYEYLMRHFATQSGKSKGQFYTPAEVSRIMARVIGIGPDTARDRSVYDPTCGSGSLLIKASDEAPHGLTIFGQEMDVATWTMARMNMILHGHTPAEIERGNTLAAPRFTDSRGFLQRFDFAVANPPFSTKAWSNGLDPSHDMFRRFEYGVPPAKNGDYAFLLHLVASLKSTGKGAIILPHGVLFRGNREAGIRRNLVEHGLIEGVIGLPANLFYGTGIPACIVVIDKENAATRDGVFMIDASQGFRKDGAKNRLRERDIHRIVDVFNERRGVPGYSRMVPMAEIAGAANDYNLNIPRYIDSGEPEDLHDLKAHLRGGIPNRDIDALECYWQMFPGLRRALFAQGSREGYSEACRPPDAMKAIVLGHEGFMAYKDQVEDVLAGWRRKHAPRLLGLQVGDSPKALIRDLSEDLLGRFAGLPLLECYGVYQCLMDYWDGVMQDDVYLVVTEGWAAGRQLRLAHKDEAPDFWRKKGRKTTRYVGMLVPAVLVIERFFSEQKAQADSVEAALTSAAERKSEFEEEHTGDAGALSDLEGQKGITKDKVRQRAVALKDVILQTYGHGISEYQQASKIGKTTFGDRPWETGTVDPEGLFAELDVLYEWLQFANKESMLRREHNGVIDDLYAMVEAKYDSLTEDEIRTLVVGDKWAASIEDAIDQQVEQLTHELVDRVSVLEARYAESLPDLVRRVEDLDAKIEGHLERMGFSV